MFYHYSKVAFLYWLFVLRVMKRGVVSGLFGSTFGWYAPPGKQLLIANIPSAVVNNHNEVFFYWQEFKLRNGCLYRVDAHPDMGDGVDVRDSRERDYYKQMCIANFNSPAVHHGFFKEIFWNNPQEKTLVTYNSKKGHDMTEVVDGKICWSSIHKKPVQKVLTSRDLYLDIDLDGLSLSRGDISQSVNWELRLQELVNCLVELPVPKAITIARSQGDKLGDEFVPRYFVDKVQEGTIEALIELYSERK